MFSPHHLQSSPVILVYFVGDEQCLMYVSIFQLGQSQLMAHGSLSPPQVLHQCLNFQVLQFLFRYRHYRLTILNRRQRQPHKNLRLQGEFLHRSEQ